VTATLDGEVGEDRLINNRSSRMTFESSVATYWSARSRSSMSARPAS
jgi:hypothetical protein